MREEIFCFEKNGYKVTKLKVLGSSFFVVTGNGRRFIRKSLKSVNEITG